MHRCALHGFAGIVFAMHRGRALLHRTRPQELVTRTCLTLQRTALREGDYVNWPIVVDAADSACAGAAALRRRAGHCQ